MKTIYSLVAVLLVLSACNNAQKQSTEEKQRDSVEIQQPDMPVLKDTTLVGLTKTILKQLKDKNYQALAQYIHPEAGVRFSPYGYINTKENVIIQADQLNNMLANNEKIVWGAYDGTGDEIKLTLQEYFDKFVYEVNFIKAEKLSVNQSLAKGNSLNNIEEVYPDAEYTESYFSGFEKKYNGMDWRALRLVYKEYGGKKYLVGIIHDQWTI